MPRCDWAEESSSPILKAYHDFEWGVPVHDDRTHFEFLVLEGAQAGLSWLTVLKRREGYRALFAGFDPEQVARFGEEDVQRLVADKRIIRNRAKIVSTIENARMFLGVQEEFGSFDDYFWSFVDGKPIQNSWERMEDLPATTDLSTTISNDLRLRGFSFVGPTIVYAHMQAAGLVNDHLVSCFRHREVAKMSNPTV